MSLGNLANNPLVNLFLTWLANSDQSRVQGEYENDADQQYANQLRAFRERSDNTLGIYDRGNQNALNELDDAEAASRDLARTVPANMRADQSAFLQQFDNRGRKLLSGLGAGQDAFLAGVSGESEPILGGYRDRYAMAESELNKLGDQEREDIEERFANREGELTQNLIQRGLASSSTAAKNMLGVEREKSGELRRLSEDLARERIRTLSSLSGDELSARERFLWNRANFANANVGRSFDAASKLENSRAAYDAAMRGDVNAAEERLSGNTINQKLNLGQFLSTIGANRANLYADTWGDYANAIERQLVPPQPNQYGYQFGANSVQVPKPPSSLSSFLGGAAPGAGAAVGALGASLLFPPAAAAAGGGWSTTLAGKGFWGCIDGEAMVMTPEGQKPIRDVQIGDLVQSVAGIYAPVIKKDYGAPHESRKGEYIELAVGANRLILTRDHIVFGKPADHWKVGATVWTGQWVSTVQSIAIASAVPSGDLLLEDGVPYIVNDEFVVASMIM